MAELTTQQLAQLLLGIARAQNAIVEAIESSKAGFKGTYLRPTIESAARIKTNRPESLADYPSRLLLQMIGRGAPDLDNVVRDLGKLLNGPAAAAPAAGPGAPPATSGDDSSSLDMTRGDKT